MVKLSFTENEVAAIREFFENELVKHQTKVEDLQGLLSKVGGKSVITGGKVKSNADRKVKASTAEPTEKKKPGRKPKAAPLAVVEKKKAGRPKANTGINSEKKKPGRKKAVWSLSATEIQPEAITPILITEDKKPEIKSKTDKKSTVSMVKAVTKKKVSDKKSSGRKVKTIKVEPPIDAV